MLVDDIFFVHQEWMEKASTMTQHEEHTVFAEVCLAALEFAFCKTVILAGKPQTKWSRLRSPIKTTASPGFPITAEQVIDDSLGQGTEDEIPSVEVNFDLLHAFMERNIPMASTPR